jgi:TPR repeat protein
MRAIFLLLIAMILVGCQQDNPSQASHVSSANSAALTFDQVNKEERESYVVLTLDSPIFKKYYRLAEEGDSSAQFRVSSVYSEQTKYAHLKFPNELANSNLSEHDKTIAADKNALIDESDMWMRKSAENGNGAAQRELGYRYLAGLRVKKDIATAINWFELSAANEDLDAILSLGTTHHEGKVVARDCQKALDYYLRLNALEEKNQTQIKSGRYYLGILYEDKACVPKALKDAFFWNIRGANYFIPAALNNVGLSYEFGHYVSRDMSTAAGYYAAAANRNYSVAQYNLGLCYAKGLGVIKDLKQAYFWMLLASAKEDRDAIRMREQLERSLSPEELNQAKSEAKNWKAI